MRHTIALLLFSGLLAMPALAAPDTDTDTDTDKQAMTREAKSVTGELVSELGGALKKALAESGPDGAITVCRDIAPELANALSLRTGWKVTRVSLKPRNPMIGQPDAWEQTILQQFDEAAKGGADAGKLVAAEIVSEPDGDYFRFMKALPVKPLCLTCHGSGQRVSASVQETLAREYPHDKATGYYAGQIRGAVTIKRKLEATN